jgi:hypothetical protein
MKATLEFNLPEEETNFKYAMSARDMAMILTDLQIYIRSKIKHEVSDPDQLNAYENVRDELHSLLDDRNVTLP